MTNLWNRHLGGQSKELLLLNILLVPQRRRPMLKWLLKSLLILIAARNLRAVTLALWSAARCNS